MSDIEKHCEALLKQIEERAQEDLQLPTPDDLLQVLLLNSDIRHALRNISLTDAQSIHQARMRLNFAL